MCVDSKKHVVFGGPGARMGRAVGVVHYMTPLGNGHVKSLHPWNNNSMQQGRHVVMMWAVTTITIAAENWLLPSKSTITIIIIIQPIS